MAPTWTCLAEVMQSRYHDEPPPTVPNEVPVRGTRSLVARGSRISRVVRHVFESVKQIHSGMRERVGTRRSPRGAFTKVAALECGCLRRLAAI
jgi:hypothetical protein